MPADNSLVAFLLIVGGLTLAVLTVTLLIYTGVMTGSFISNMMRKRGITASALSGFLTHGIPEMSAILFAGAVGLEIGHIATKSALDSSIIEVRGLVVHTVRRFSIVFLMLVISAFLEVYITPLVVNYFGGLS